MSRAAAFWTDWKRLYSCYGALEIVGAIIITIIIIVIVCAFCVNWQGVDLRQYSKNVEAELLEVENVSIQDCILCVFDNTQSLLMRQLLMIVMLKSQSW